jgi:pilus assembly protein Flp/PilA
MQFLNDFALRALIKASSGVEKFKADTKGVTAIEYGLIAGLIAVGLVTALGLLGNSLKNVFNTIQTNLANA